MFIKLKINHNFDSISSNKLESLKKYCNIFLKSISKENLSLEEEKYLAKGILEVQLYIVQGLIIDIMANYDSKTPFQKKMEVMFHKSKRKFNNNKVHLAYIKEELEIIVYEEILNALGFGETDKIFNKNKNTSNFILYVKQNSSFKLFKFLETLSLEAYNIEECFIESEDEEVINLTVREIIAKCGLLDVIPEEVLHSIEDSCENGKNFPEFVKPYINLMSKRISIDNIYN